MAKRSKRLPESSDEPTQTEAQARAEQPLPVPIFPKTEERKIDPDRVIEKAWKQGEHARAAQLIVDKTGSMAALIEAIPADEKLIRETLAQRGVY